jgi:hypothetical protein
MSQTLIALVHVFSKNVSQNCLTNFTTVTCDFFLYSSNCHSNTWTKFVGCALVIPLILNSFLRLWKRPSRFTLIYTSSLNKPVDYISNLDYQRRFLTKSLITTAKALTECLLLTTVIDVFHES